jgi:oligopeptide transport system ATP-binding protein
MKQVLELRNLVTEFETDEGIVQAVNGVSFELIEGELMAIVGESGSGKSVTMLSVMNLIPSPPGRIVSGEILLNGEDLRKMSKKEVRGIRGMELAMVFQDSMTSLNPVMTIGEQLEESMRLHLHYSHATAHHRSIELLEMVGIPDPANRVGAYPHQFSGGMRQRAMIAMALACNPKVLIADEPTTALDVTIQAQIVVLVKRLRREIGMSVIWITHDLGLVASLADRVVVLYAGRVVEQGDVRDIFARPRHPYTLGLLRSTPRLDEKHRDMLLEIRGTPPNMLDLPPGCPFAERCDYVSDICWEKVPELRKTDIAGTLTACVQWETLQKDFMHAA